MSTKPLWRGRDRMVKAGERVLAGWPSQLRPQCLRAAAAARRLIPCAREIGTHVEAQAARVVVGVEDQVGRLDAARA